MEVLVVLLFSILEDCTEENNNKKITLELC